MGEFETDAKRALPPIQLPPKAPRLPSIPPPDDCVTPAQTPQRGAAGGSDFETPSAIYIATFTPHSENPPGGLEDLEQAALVLDGKEAKLKLKLKQQIDVLTHAAEKREVQKQAAHRLNFDDD